jgi:hypothetical protein
MALDYLTTDSDSPTSYLDPDLMAQQDALTRRRAMLVEQAKQSADNLGIYATPEAPANQPGWTSGVNGARMLAPQTRIGALQAVAPLLADVGRTVADSNFTRDQSGYNRLSQAAVSQHMQAKPDDDAPLNERLAWAQKGAQIPALAPLMNDYTKDQLISEPDRVAARQDRLTQAAADRAQRAATAAGQQQTSRDNAALMAAAMGGRQNQLIQGTDGKWYSANKPGGTATPVMIEDPDHPGQQVPLDKLDPKTKEAQRANSQAQTNAKLALGAMDEVDSLLAGKDASGKKTATPTSSGFGALIDEGYRFAGLSNEGMRANAPIKKLSAWLESITPTGNVRTNMAREAARRAVGELDDPTKSLEEKRAAAKTVRESLVVLQSPASYVDPVTRQPGSPPPLNTAPVEGSTMLRQSAPSNKVRTYNPATRSLE